MQAFKRIFKYIRPQWPRVVIVIIAAAMVGILFSFSFMTVIPLLKVMMGEEGLHAWADRNICDWRFGVEFYVPDTIDFTRTNNRDITSYLLITDVKERRGIKEKTQAYKAGLKEMDRILFIADATGQDSELLPSVPRGNLLMQLAAADQQSSLILHIERPKTSGEFENIQIQLNTGTDKFYVKFAADRALWGVNFLPESLSGLGKAKAVVYIIILMGVVTIIRCISTFYQKFLAEKITQVSLVGLREDVFAHVVEMPVGFFSSKGTSDTISRLVNDIGGIGKGVKIMLGKALREPMKAFFCLAGAFIISWKLTLIFLSCAPFVLGLAFLLGRKIKKYTRRSLRSSAAMLGRLDGAINALRVVKVYNQQKHERAAYSLVNRRLLKQVLHIAKVDSATGPLMETLGMIAGSAALMIGVYWVASANMLSSSFFGLLIALGISAESIRKSSDIWNKIQSANAAAERVFAVVDEPAEFEKPNAFTLSTLKHSVEFRDVVFTYPNCKEPVLKGVNLTVEAGHNIAIVGPNGSGKTTLINLIPRFYNPDSGSILIDGKNIADCTLKSLREQIGIVTQNVVTFNDTVAANIAYGKPDAAMDEIIDAARRSFADEFVSLLPNGYDTVIGEHGAGLSGGQLQRIVIARAILKNPAILIFDEATSQIDANSEAKIHQAIEDFMQNRTTFLIAHRFSTVVSADIIIVMDNGQIIAQGHHSELIEQCPLYQSLYEKQLITQQ